MKEVLQALKNVKGGPKTTVIGALMMILGGVLIYTADFTFTWASVEVGIFIVGVYLCLINDSKKDE